jgi:hypothetical protein
MSAPSSRAKPRDQLTLVPRLRLGTGLSVRLCRLPFRSTAGPTQSPQQVRSQTESGNEAAHLQEACPPYSVIQSLSKDQFSLAVRRAVDPIPPLVPKLHLGTLLSAQLRCPSLVPRLRLGTSLSVRLCRLVSPLNRLGDGVASASAFPDRVWERGCTSARGPPLNPTSKGWRPSRSTENPLSESRLR